MTAMASRVVPEISVIPRRILMRRTREIGWRIRLVRRIQYFLGYRILRVSQILRIDSRVTV